VGGHQGRALVAQKRRGPQLKQSLHEELKVAEKATRELKTVFLLYAKVDGIGLVSSFTETARSEWESSLENLSSLQGQVIKELCASLAHEKNKADDLELENQQLVQDKKRLLLQLRESLGVSPKSMETKEFSNKDTQKTDEDNRVQKKRGAPKGHPGKSRPLPNTWEFEEVVPAISTCSCGCAVKALEECDHKFIEDIPDISKITTRRSYQLGQCTGCQKIHRHEEGHHGPPVEIGPNLSAHLVMMRQMGCTYRKLSQFCKDTLGIGITPSGILGIVSRVTEKLRPTYDEIGSMLRTQDVVHGDETGWKVGKESWYIWVFCNRHMAYFRSSDTRAGSVPIETLGKSFNGTLVCDFYGAYNFAQKLQRCLIHYTRDIHEEREIFPGHKGLESFENMIWEVINEGEEIQKIPSIAERSLNAKGLEKKLDEALKFTLPTGKPTTLQNRIEKFRGELLTFAENPEVEYHNNRAERQVRPMVISRKMSYGSDSSLGADRTCVLHSVVETCRLNGRKPVDYLRATIVGAGNGRIFSDEVLSAGLPDP